jgi:ubiquinone/menaquinone biosynthesis C-methylase UbiE
MAVSIELAPTRLANHCRDAISWLKMSSSNAKYAAESATLFKYRCNFGQVDFFCRADRGTRCIHCGAIHPTSQTGVIDFVQRATERNAYFDQIYSAGRSHKLDGIEETLDRTYKPGLEIARRCPEICGHDPSHRVENLAILDVACGSGWVTAGLLQQETVRNCRLHAFDISPHGPELLARLERTIPHSNRVETSVQDASAMLFEDRTFDVIIGSSVLHHFDDVRGFLTDCKRILKPGGVATFGEPFALGYGLGAAALMVAQRQTGRFYPGLVEHYNDLACRIKGSPELLASLVDKHLFFQSSFLSQARSCGFESVEFVPLATRNYYVTATFTN